MIYNAVFFTYTLFTAYFCLKGLEGAILVLPFYVCSYLYWFEDLKPDLIILCSEKEEAINTILDCIEDQFSSIQMWKPTDEFLEKIKDKK